MIFRVLNVLLSSLVVLQSFRPDLVAHLNQNRALYDARTPGSFSGQMKTDKIFIGNLPFTVSESILREIVAANIGEGKIKEIKIAAGKKTKRPLGFLFADFTDFEAAAAAVSLFDGYNLDGRILNSNLKFVDDISLIKTMTKNVEKVKATTLSSLKTNKTIYLSNLDYSLDEEQICNMCDDLVGVGLVSEVRIPLDKETGSPRGFAYIEFKDAASVDIGITELSEVEVYGRILKAERMSMPKKKEAVLTVEQEQQKEEEDIFASLSY